MSSRRTFGWWCAVAVAFSVGSLVAQGGPYKQADIESGAKLYGGQACAASKGGQDALAHAHKISNGGAPVVMIAEEETVTF